MGKYNYRVLFTVFNRHNGDIAIEQESKIVQAKNAGVATLTVVTELRDKYIQDDWRIIVHESIWTDVDNLTDV